MVFIKSVVKLIGKRYNKVDQNGKRKSEYKVRTTIIDFSSFN